VRVWKWLSAIVVVLFVIFAGLGYVVQSSGVRAKIEQQFNPKLKPLEVKFGSLETGDVVRAVNAPGEIEPRENVEISAQVSARIVDLPFDEGDRVKKGDVVVRLDNRDLAALLDGAKAQLRSEEARLDGSRAQLANAEVELARRQKLVANGDIPQVELEAAQLEYDRALSTLRQVEQGIESARANIRRAEKDLDNTIITSPIDGIMTKRNAEVGETVVVGTLNNAGSVILEIADLDRMMVKARVDEANIGKVKEGQKAVVYINAYADLRLSGTVDRVGLKRLVDSNGTRYFETEVLIDRPKDLLLRSGLTSNVDIQVENFDDVLKVPSQAVLDRAIDDLPESITKDNPNIDAAKKFTRVVFVEKEGKAVPVPVRTGASDETHTVVLGGLEKDARVIVGPFKALAKIEKDQLIVAEGTLKKETDAVASAGLPDPSKGGQKPPR
jgi:HlyD family secretion protein